jgi:hypothetical protein
MRQLKNSVVADQFKQQTCHEQGNNHQRNKPGQEILIADSIDDNVDTALDESNHESLVVDRAGSDRSSFARSLFVFFIHC